MATSHNIVPAAGRVLVADDTKQVRELLHRSLSRHGFDVVAVENGEGALAALDQSDFDLLVLDIQMPGISGLEVLRQLQSSDATRSLPVILLTGEGEPYRRVEGLDLGAVDYVVKPFEMTELLARVRTHIRTRSVWQREVEARLGERGAAVRALALASSRPLLEDRAAAIADNLTALHAITGAVVVWLTPEGGAVPIAVAGTGFTVSRDRRLDRATAAYLTAQAAQGPWVQVSGGGATTPLEPELADCPVVWAPVGISATPDALLGVASPPWRSPAEMSQLLAGAVDYAAVASGVIGRDLRRVAEDRLGRFDVEAVIRREQFTPHFQPVVHLRSGAVVGYEALTRFEDGVAPDRRFIEAGRLGLGLDLEQATIAAAVRAARALPPGRWLSLNVSPALVRATNVLGQALSGADREVILEMTEHDPIDDYAELESALASLPQPYRLSIDDAGSGFASLRHILSLRPAFIKLDSSWALTIDTDRARQALVAGLLRFAAGTRAQLIAEGIETSAQRSTLANLGVTLGQGYLLGRPAPADSLRP